MNRLRIPAIRRPLRTAPRGVAASLLLAALTAGSPPARAETPAVFQPLAFLLGAWDAGANAGAPGQGAGGCVFRLDLQDKVIVRTSHAEYPAAGGRPAATHDDLMIVYAGEAGGLRADYYDNEGHVIRYGVTANADGSVSFLSDVAGGAPRYRLGYRPGTDGAVEGRFEVAPPDKPDAFRTYLTWEMTKRKAP